CVRRPFFVDTPSAWRAAAMRCSGTASRSAVTECCTPTPPTRGAATARHTTFGSSSAAKELSIARGRSGRDAADGSCVGATELSATSRNDATCTMT
ncbi:hypothetical protein LSAT2_011681, partial [Lamellibrachia satsuma]